MTAGPENEPADPQDGTEEAAPPMNRAERRRGKASAQNTQFVRGKVSNTKFGTHGAPHARQYSNRKSGG